MDMYSIILYQGDMEKSRIMDFLWDEIRVSFGVLSMLWLAAVVFMVSGKERTNVYSFSARQKQLYSPAGYGINKT